MWWVPLVLLGCGGNPTEALLQQFETDPDGVLRTVTSTADPIAQESFVLRLAETYPGRTRAFCGVLPAGPARSRCERIHQRSHLWVPSVDEVARPWTPRPGGGPLETRIPIQSALLRTQGLPAAAVGSCIPNAANLNLCLTDQARSAASHGDFQTASARCAAASSPRWAQDCFVQAAEVGAAVGGYEVALTYCGGAGSFAPECHLQVLHALVESLFPQGMGVGHACAGATTLARQVEASWSSRSPDLGRIAVDAFWTLFVARLAVEGGQELADPLGLLPDGADPHVRDHLALRVIGHPDPWKSATNLVKSGHALAVALPPTPKLVEKVDLWTTDMPGEEAIPSVYFWTLGSGRRPTDPDPEVDLRLALAHAAAHAWPPFSDVLTADLQHPNALVRWNAVMLLGAIVPGHGGIAALQDDPDALVRQRAAFATRRAQVGGG